ncbi:hypothetical protein ACQKQD_29845 [Methylobacterium sp. NPDC080182]|uniref:hypothetical protein n=1 Tax=Methylobacterium sp. NPDC080182 TaxID=3390590 RepID=UPI003CFDA92D
MQLLGLGAPSVALILDGLDASVEVAGLAGGFHQQILGVAELLAQLGILRGQGEEQGRQVIAPGMAHRAAPESGAAPLTEPHTRVDVRLRGGGFARPQVIGRLYAGEPRVP